jgi:hypothetical protein
MPRSKFTLDWTNNLNKTLTLLIFSLKSGFCLPECVEQVFSIHIHLLANLSSQPNVVFIPPNSNLPLAATKG